MSNAIYSPIYYTNLYTAKNKRFGSYYSSSDGNFRSYHQENNHGLRCLCAIPSSVNGANGASLLATYEDAVNIYRPKNHNYVKMIRRMQRKLNNHLLSIDKKAVRIVAITSDIYNKDVAEYNRMMDDLVALASHYDYDLFSAEDSHYIEFAFKVLVGIVTFDNVSDDLRDDMNRIVASYGNFAT